MGVMWDRGGWYPDVRDSDFLPESQSLRAPLPILPSLLSISLTLTSGAHSFPSVCSFTLKRKCHSGLSNNCSRRGNVAQRWNVCHQAQGLILSSTDLQPDRQRGREAVQTSHITDPGLIPIHCQEWP